MSELYAEIHTEDVFTQSVKESYGQISYFCDNHWQHVRQSEYIFAKSRTKSF